MEPAPQTYQRLPGTRRTPFRRATLWLGADHILSVNSARFSEEYKRYYFKDIQAIVVRQTSGATAMSKALDLVVEIVLALLAFSAWRLQSRGPAIAGAVCGVTIRPRSPSGTNRIRLWGVLFCADARPVVRTVKPADSNTSERRIDISPERSIPASRPWPLFSFARRQFCYILPRQLYALRNPAAWASSSEQNQRSGLVRAG